MEHRQILRKLKLKEKIALCSGRDVWHTKDLSRYGLPSIMMCDGPHGLRYQPGKADILGINNSLPATCFPAAVTTACSWDPELMQEVGAAIAREAKASGVGLVLGPGVNIKRDPLCGRNFEYFSEDPYLAGKLAAAFIRGGESTGVGTCVKHFALNNQEYKRGNGNSMADERTMREIYLTPFEIAVTEGKPAAVMCAYNKINGVHASDDPWLLNWVLRQEWGFDGLVVTDWGAMNDRIAAMQAGCDLMMPGGSDYMEKELERAVEKGRLSEADIDRCVLRVLQLMERGSKLPKEPFCQKTHHAIAKKAAAGSAVLLKNDDRLLPLQETAKVAVIGAMAKKPRYQGAGSSHINPLSLSVAADFIPGVYAPGCNDDGSTTETLLAQAVEAARAAEAAVVFAGLPDAWESEGFDREDMKMPEGHLRLIAAVAEANPNTAVVLSCGGAVEIPWADDVKAILYVGLPGQSGGEAIADLLYGRENPSGKLAESWPCTYEDCVTAPYYRNRKDPQYRESVYVGYRYYDKGDKPVRWPFGHGLSYTEFTYSDLRAEDDRVTVTVTNTGRYPGGEVVQLYVCMPQDGLHRPVKELKGFCKVFLQPGQSREVSFSLDSRSFALWNGSWQIPAGAYKLMIAGSSRDIRLVADIRKDGVTVTPPAWQDGSWYAACRGTPSREDWEKIYGKVPPERPLQKGSFTMDDAVSDMKAYSLVMKLFYEIVVLVISKPFGFRRDHSNPQFRMLLRSSVDGPLRNLQQCGGLKGGLIPAMLRLANGGVRKK